MLDVKSKGCEHEGCNLPACEIDNTGRSLCEQHFTESRVPVVHWLVGALEDMFSQIAAQTRLCNGDVMNACMSLVIQSMVEHHKPEEAEEMIVAAVKDAFARGFRKGQADEV